MKRKAAVLALMIVVAGCGSSASDPAISPPAASATMNPPVSSAAQKVRC